MVVCLVTVKNRLMKKGHKSVPSKQKSHLDDELRMYAELSRNSDLLSQEPRWPVIDQARPYVCQHCGVGFAREKVQILVKFKLNKSKTNFDKATMWCPAQSFLFKKSPCL